MGTVTRKATGVETLTLADCPECGGGVGIGYVAETKKARAQCKGRCHRSWFFQGVSSPWLAGERWNSRRSLLKLRLRAFALLKLDPSEKHRRDELDLEAAKMLGIVKKKILDGTLYGG